MLSLSEVKAKYSNLYIEGFVMVHRAMAKNLEDLAKVAPRLATMSQQELRELSNWFDFIFVMIEQHHRHEDDPAAAFSFPDINKQHPISGLDTLLADHHMLDELLVEVKEKLHQLAAMNSSNDRTAFIARLQQIIPQAEQHLKDHLQREETVFLPLVTSHYTKAEQMQAGKQIAKKNQQETPKQYAAYGLPWAISGISDSERADFLKALPLPPKLLLRFAWNKKYAQFTNVINN